jgi:nucleoside recognition membrane protein YjiH
MSAWLVDLLVLLGILAIVIIAGYYVFSQITLAEPLRRILMVVIVIIAAIVGIMILLQMRGGVRLSDHSRPFLAASAAISSVDL